jgi:hypothetical protein
MADHVKREQVAMVILLVCALLAFLSSAFAGAQPARSTNSVAALLPEVEAEEDVYSYEAANNGAGPLWCSGSTCLVRSGGAVFASGIETLKDAKPLNNRRWLLFKRESTGWQLQQADATGRTREPCPLVCFPNGQLFLSINSTLAPADTYAGPARPEILQILARDVKLPGEHLLPVWDGSPSFTEHSYRSSLRTAPPASWFCSKISATPTLNGCSGTAPASGLPRGNCRGQMARTIRSPNRFASATPTWF